MESTNIIIYQTEDGVSKIQTVLKDETVWLSQAQLVILYQSSKSNISEHIKHIFEEEELQKESVVRNFRITATDGKNYNVEHYNLDLILSLGYRVKSKIATHFRQWATARLREYIVKGFTIDDEKLKNVGGGVYWKELLDRIKDIRSSEKVLYRQVLDLYATSIDYDPRSAATKQFFATVQNKLHYAANGKTAAEIVNERADAEKPLMGLLSFSKDGIKKNDVKIAKNYLTEIEIKRLNNIVSAYFDIAELRALDELPTSMQDYIGQLDKLILSMDRKVLQNAGTVSHIEAEAKALSEYKKFQSNTLSNIEKSYLENMNALQKEVVKKV